MNAIKIFPSLISSPSLLNLGDIINQLSPYCDGFHVDIMDNHFVKNLSWGPSFVNQIAHFTNKPLSVHIMAEKPKGLIEQLKLKAKSSISFHVESGDNVDEILTLIKAKKLIASIALKPETPFEKITPYLDNVDQLLLMSVEPGFSSQKFLPESFERLKKVVDYKQKKSLSFEIVMDGGINKSNIHELVRLGCTGFCIASAIFDSESPVEALKDLYVFALEG